MGAMPATFGQRFLAVFIDWLIGLALIIPVVIVAAILGAISETLGALVGVLLYLAVILGFLYMVIGGIGLTGQTPGKRSQGIKVMNDSGGAVGVGNAVVRHIVQYVTNIPCYVGSFWMLWDGEKKTLYDKMLGNQVVQAEKGGIMPIFPDGKPF